ncbi:MAG TPA: aminoglycoside phosphotransferase family protein [Nevskiaceae bacterium]|nr:aminoglycoside phosphotransferase family protein [Nevskiaceae bacterium]
MSFITSYTDAEHIIRQHYPQAQHIEYIDHGHVNFVATVDNAAVFRFPRDANAVKRLHYEIELFKLLQDAIPVVPIPIIIAVNHAPEYAITNFIPGEHLTGRQIRCLPQAQQAAIGHTLATFIYQFTQRVSAGQLRHIRQKTGVEDIDEPWDDYFRRMFTPGLPDKRLQPVVDRQYHAWLQAVAHENRNLAIHDDIHTANVLFTDNKVSAVLDFGDAYIGSIEEELRGLYRMSDTVVAAAADQYVRLGGAPLRLDNVRTWAIANELANFIDRTGKGDITHPSYLRAQANLRKWLPDFPL